MSDTPLQYTYSGDRFLLGYGADFIGIWDRHRTDPRPVERFPRDDGGWTAAWTLFVALQPDHVAVGLSADPPQVTGASLSHRGAAPSRVPGAWWLLPLVFGWIGGAIAWFALRRRDPRIAAWMFLAGVVSNLVGLWLYGMVVPTLPSG